MRNVATNNTATSTDHTAMSTSNHLVETSRQILTSLLKALDVPNDVSADEQPAAELESTEHELEDLKFIPESDRDSSLPKTINDICVTSDSRSNQIDYIIDCRRMITKCQVYYLAKTVRSWVQVISGTMFWLKTT